MEFLRRLGRLYRAQFRTVGRLRPTLRGLLLRTVAWVIVAWLSLGIAVWLTPGVEIEQGGSVLAAVAIIALVEVAIRPLLMAVALPIGLIAVAIIGLLFRIVVFLVVLPLVGISVDGFVSALSVGFRISAVIILGTAALVWRFLPNRARDHREVVTERRGVALGEPASAG